MPSPAVLPLASSGASTVDSTTWAALALVLTLLGAVWAWVSWRRRGVAAGLRGLAWTLVPVAAWLTGTLKLIGGIVEDVVDWAARLVFSPTVWLGVIVAGVAVALWVLSGLLGARGIGVREGGRDRSVRSRRRDPEVQAGTTGAPKSAKGPTKRAARAAEDDDPDDMADIEAILKRHGI